MKPHNTTTIPEQLDRLPEPWRSKAIARCEAYYGKKLDEIRTTFHELDGEPFGFLQFAFPWHDAPEGHAVWEAISAWGVFPPSGTTATTYRQLINERLPEPFRTQALENTTDERLDQEVMILVDLEPGFEFVSSLFTWSVSPQGHDYWSRVRRGDLSQDTAPAPLPDERIANLESRIAVLEGLVTKPEAPVCGDGDSYPSTPPDPGPGYRLVEKGELIEEGDEWFEVDGIWHPTELGGSGARKNIDTPLRRRVAPPSYRLLNPGETIRASDEVYLYGKWKEMAGDNGVGETFDPEEDYPIRRRIKSYEDA